MAPIEKKRKRPVDVHEEPAAFPRGGGSLLTPLEHKQIQIEATRDVLFEQQGSKAKTTLPGAPVVKGRKRLKTKETGGSKQSSKDTEEKTIKIEGLNYKRLLTGSLVLGQVTQINDHDIALSLPNNLTGYVPITSISDRLTERVEALAVTADDASDKEDMELADIELRELFQIGQYLRAYVVSTSESPVHTRPEKPKRRIELSLRPQQTNNHLLPAHVVPNSTLMASVISVEDHGMVMDLGLQDRSMRGFVSSNELGPELKLSDIQEGAVLICMVTGLNANGKIVKLTASPDKIGNTKKSHYLSEAPNVDTFLPGTAIDFLVAEITPWGIVGKLMGMIDVTADLIHSGAGAGGVNLESKYKIGGHLKARILYTFVAADVPKLGISLLDHVLSFNTQQAIKHGEKHSPLSLLPLSTIIEEAKVKDVEPGIGLFIDLGIKGVCGFVHISRVKDGKIETLSKTSGQYKVGSVHRARLVGYNSLDGVFLASLEPSILAQPFLRIEDLTIGDIVEGKVEKVVVNAAGIGGVLVNLATGITGLVPVAHMSDVHLQHPEKKFREGAKVTARVLSTDTRKQQIRLTLKKTLVNSEAVRFVNYGDISVGMQSPGTIINILSSGAVVQFYGHIRGFLPVAEMSEAYIQQPSQHFRIGQVVNVRVLSVEAELEKLMVSCRDPTVLGVAQQSTWSRLKIGELVSGSVTEKSGREIQVSLQGSGLRASLPVGQLTDGSDSKNASTLKKIRVGAVLSNLAILDKLERQNTIILTNKESLVKAATDRVLLRGFEDVKEGKIGHGFVRNIDHSGAFIEFGGGLTGLLPKSKLSHEAISLPDFGLKRLQTVRTTITSVDHAQRRFLLSMSDSEAKVSLLDQLPPSSEAGLIPINPVDDSIRTFDDISLGQLTKARVVSVKDTQINVQLADNIQGRIDVSQIFDTWETIKDRKRPLRSFSSRQVLDVRILGIHDARNHRFLPISHRGSKSLVFELSTKPSDLVGMPPEPLDLAKMEVGSSWIAFVNNVGEDCLWVNLSPNIRGRIRALDVSDDVSLLEDLGSNFPVGSALRVYVTGIDATHNRLDLSARSARSVEPLTINALNKGMIIAGKVIRADERVIKVQLGNNLLGSIHLTDLADDFSMADPGRYRKNDIVRLCVIDVDGKNNKVRLSMRPSRVLNSSLAVQDPEVLSVSQLKVNDVVRGFIKNVSDKGLFINLGGDVTGYARVADLSDAFLKDWKSHFKMNQLVKVKVIATNPSLDQVQVSLKCSVIENKYDSLLAFGDMRSGQIITGRIRKVEDYGVFIVVDGSENVSGLCHQSELAEQRVRNVREIYEEGDAVKAKVLKIDTEKKRINFGLKASYFEDESPSEDDSDDDDDDLQGASVTQIDHETDERKGEVQVDDVPITENVMADDANPSNETILDLGDEPMVTSLGHERFDWQANIFDEVGDHSDGISQGSDTVERAKKRKRGKTQTHVDKTGDLDINGPQSVSDFERLLLGQPDSSQLWIQYMAFQMQLNELSKAREVAERAFKTISLREDTEKLNVWTALLNLECAYGSDESIEEVFKRACQYNDTQEIHERLVSIYIQSGKHGQADLLFQALVKKFAQSPAVWYNYAHFLHVTLSAPDRARGLLPRATQSLPPYTHVKVTLKFAALEFHSPSGSPERGRTIFEGVLSTFPKKLDIWNQLLDLELQQGDQDIIRGIFDRVARIRGLKPKGAKAWFKRWAEWEEQNGDRNSCERVKARAEEWVQMASQRKGVEHEHEQ